MSTTAPYAHGSDTSREAALSMDGHLARLEEMVLRSIRLNNDQGLTCDEVETLTGLNHQTASARIHALNHKKGLIRDSGNRRKTRSGRNAVVWIINDILFIE